MTVKTASCRDAFHTYTVKCIFGEGKNHFKATVPKIWRKIRGLKTKTTTAKNDGTVESVEHSFSISLWFARTLQNEKCELKKKRKKRH